MRRFKSVLPVENFNFNEAGKISLAILFIIMMALVYSKVEAKEKSYNSIFTRNNFLEELRESNQNQASLENPQKIEDRKEASTFKIQLKEEDNEYQRVLYQIDSLYDLKASRDKINKEEVAKIKKDLKENSTPAVDQTLREDVAREITGTKMEPMIDCIAAQGRETAALLVGIARIESGYSHNYSYNFWGYAGGYYGFNNPEQAVEVVGKRINELRSQGLNTPAKIVTTWKCGRSCAGHAPGSVQRWISTVSEPYYRIAMK